MARDYVTARGPGLRPATLVEFELDQELARAISDWYDTARSTSGTAEEPHQYDLFKRETSRQFDYMHERGIVVEPWLEEGQPYASSAHLAREVRRTGHVWVYLTSNGHGTDSSAHRSASEHPLTEPSPYRRGGIQLCQNDVFRAVHDVFGHVARGNPFTAHGEFMAAFDHAQMYPEECHPVLLAETIGQVCWFYYGPHLRRQNGWIPTHGDPDYIKPRHRPFSPQKTTPLPQEHVAAFFSLFKKVN